MKPRLVLIGGAPRCGKSLLTSRIIEHHPFAVLSTDFLRDPLRKFVSASDQPALYENERTDGSLLDRVDRQNRESAVVWTAVEQYVVEQQAWSDQLLLVEGVAVLPEYASALSRRFELKAIFVGNQSPDHVDVLMEHAASSEHDWLRGWSRERVERFAEFKVAMSQWVEASAREFGFEYVETAGDFEARLERAKSALSL